MRQRTVTFAIGALLIVVGLAVAAQYQSCRQTVVTLPDNQDITVEVADSVLERSRGLSNRDSLEPDTGMLFLFPNSDIHTFWMKDTRIPLDIIWIQDNRVVDMATLEAEQGTTIPQHQPSHNANAVLELNKNEAAEHGVTIGSPITWKVCQE